MIFFNCGSADLYNRRIRKLTELDTFSDLNNDVVYQTRFYEFRCEHLLKDISRCRFGHLEKVQVVLDGHSGRSRGFAFVYFESVDDATEARNKMTGTDLDGK